MANKSPNVQTTFSADRILSIADLQATGTAGARDLTAISLMGNFAPQLIRLNNSGAAAATIIMTPEYGPNVTIVLNPTSQYEVICPIKATVSCDVATVSALLYWWAANLTTPFNR
jgi:hypothetical protein